MPGISWLDEELLASEGLCFALSQLRIRHFLCNTEVRYGSYLSQPLVCVLSHVSPVHNIISEFFKVQFNIIYSFVSTKYYLFLQINSLEFFSIFSWCMRWLIIKIFFLYSVTSVVLADSSLLYELNTTRNFSSIVIHFIWTHVFVLPQELSELVAWVS